MIRIEKYYCDLCGKEFDMAEECEKHERTHYTNWEEADNNKIIEELRRLSEGVYDYRVNGTVLGYFVSDFSNLIHEAAKRLEEAAKMDEEEGE